jgi:hypothetical protein
MNISFYWLSLVLGWEAVIVLQDSRGHTRRHEREVIAWAAQSLVRAITEETSA